MDVLILLTAVIAAWAVGLVVAVSLCVTAARSDRASERGRWLSPI